MALTTKDLLKILEENKDVSLPKHSQSYVNDVHKFIVVFKIKEGKHRVSNTILYRAYKMWSKETITKQQFSYRFGEFFSSFIDNTIRYYKLNYRPVELLNRVDNIKEKK